MYIVCTSVDSYTLQKCPLLGSSSIEQVVLYKVSLTEAVICQVIQNFNVHPSQEPLKTGLVQMPTLQGERVVQIPYPSTEFDIQMLLSKTNSKFMETLLVSHSLTKATFSPLNSTVDQKPHFFCQTRQRCKLDILGSKNFQPRLSSNPPPHGRPFTSNAPLHRHNK